jgi:serine/threonine-protein kinase
VPILHEHIEGKYEILGKLREGGMGAVYKVRHRLLDEVLVVKVLNPRLDVTPELSDRFLREARFAIQLRHPNIAQLHDFSIAEDGSAFIVMEFIDGATFEDIVARTGPPPLGLGLEMARQSLKALGFLHRRGLIHRDISPDNLMLTRDAEGEPLVKLIDLGIAKVLKGGAGEATSTGMFLGKPRYASPEQFSAAGLSGVDARADLYSFGVVLYELLTGVCPIQGRDPSALMAGHLFRPPLDFAESDPGGRLPADLRAILLRVLAKVPNERFASAEELTRALGEVQDRFPVKAGELETVLRAAALPAPPTSPPGSTQGKLDQQFVQTPPPAGPRAVGKNVDATIVLAAHERPPAVLPETLAIPRERLATARISPREELREVPAAPPPAPLKVVPTVAVVPPIPAPAARLEAPRVETPRVEAPPPVRPSEPPPKRRSILPLVALLALLLVAAGLGLGFWLWPQPSTTTTAAPVAATTQAAAPPAVPSASPAQTTPAVPSTSVAPPAPAPAVAPQAEPAPSIAAPAPAPPLPSPVKETMKETVKEPPVKKTAKRAEKQAPRESIAAKATAPSPTPVAPPPATASAISSSPERPKPKAKPAPREVPSAVTLHSGDLGEDETEDVGAQLVSLPSPTMPDAAKGTGSYARILVAVRVDITGKVIDTRIKNSYMEEGSAAPQGLLPAFREAAQEAARKAKFDPAQRNGKPVASWGELTFEFGKKKSGGPPSP